MKLSNESQLVLDLIQLNSRIQRRLGGALSAHGLGVSEFMVLHELSDAPGKKLRRVDLAEKVGLSASGVTRLLNPMEKIGLVEKDRSARDARVSLVALSPAGVRMLRDVEAAINDAARSLLAASSAGKLRSMQTLVRSIH